MSVVSGIMGANAAEDAAETQAESASEANATQWKMYTQSRKDQLPWLETGSRSLAELETRAIAGPGEFTESPGYQFRMDEGNKNITRTAAATGRLASGRTLKELERYGQDYASNEYDKFLGRYYDSLKPYQSLAGVGQTTAANVGLQGIATGQQIGQNTIAAGQARASGYINQANAYTGAAQSGLNAIGTYYGAQGAAAGTTAASSGSDLYGSAVNNGYYTPTEITW